MFKLFLFLLKESVFFAKKYYKTQFQLPNRMIITVFPHVIALHQLSPHLEENTQLHIKLPRSVKNCNTNTGERIDK